MRLIDADEYKKSIIEAINDQFRKDNMTGAFWLTYSDSLLDTQPTIDAVPVIRCKHCPFYKSREGDFPWCKRFEVGTQDDDYCEIDSIIEDKLREGQ